jgi:hypothetical protein
MSAFYADEKSRALEGLRLECGREVLRLANHEALTLKKPIYSTYFSSRTILKMSDNSRELKAE